MHERSSHPTQLRARLAGSALALFVVLSVLFVAPGARAAERLFELERPPTAIFAANDDMAAGVMSVAHSRGLSIPGDVSVCGFDNTPMSRQIFPALTTVHQPTQEMGRLATVELLKAIKDPASGQMIRMPYALQLRQSTGPVPRP